MVSIHLPERTPGSTVHAFAFQHNHVASGNVTGHADITPTATVDRWYFLTGVSVSADRSRGAGKASAVIALGDSITDGSDTEVNANHRWPDFLARRLAEARGPYPRGVLNQGISGNRLLHDPNPRPGPAPRTTRPTSARARCAASTATWPPSPAPSTSSSCWA
ncbi:GDSL-type esterase/lipase family protein [Streptomyces radiopugnans]|nr:GDSL-type esterase/lipase family protein [Streptomyces radiopugnans]